MIISDEMEKILEESGKDIEDYCDDEYFEKKYRSDDDCRVTESMYSDFY